MSGTFIISQDNSFDLRTIDFVRIVNALRSKMPQSATAAKLLETVDDFGMNMICADDLNSRDFADFGYLMGEVAADLGEKDKDLRAFLQTISNCIEQDERYAERGEG